MNKKIFLISLLSGSIAYASAPDQSATSNANPYAKLRITIPGAAAASASIAVAQDAKRAAEGQGDPKGAAKESSPRRPMHDTRKGPQLRTSEEAKIATEAIDDAVKMAWKDTWKKIERTFNAELARRIMSGPDGRNADDILKDGRRAASIINLNLCATLLVTVLENRAASANSANTEFINPFVEYPLSAPVPVGYVSQRCGNHQHFRLAPAQSNPAPVSAMPKDVKPWKGQHIN